MCVCDHRKIAAVAWALVVGLVGGAWAQPTSPHHGILGGPWEVLVKMGLEGTAIRLPLAIQDESKPQEMNGVLPVIGTPLMVRVKRYLPNLAWETDAVDDPEGGPTAKLSLRGENLHQDLWLSGRDRERQSVSAPIGSVAIRELPAGEASLAAVAQLTDPDAVGILLVWLRQTDAPLVYVVQPGRVLTLPDSDWTLAFPRYVPHYSIDRATKEVTSLSEKPVNPAVEVRVEGAGREYRQWFWSQFAMAPHRLDMEGSAGATGLPFQARFLDFDLGGAEGQYILAVTQDGQAVALHLEDGTKRLERIETGKRYPFTDERYTFAVEEVRGRAAIVNNWKNRSEMLLRPALVAEIEEGPQAREVVLELNQPYHHKTGPGTLVVLYRRIP